MATMTSTEKAVEKIVEKRRGFGAGVGFVVAWAAGGGVGECGRCVPHHTTPQHNRRRYALRFWLRYRQRAARGDAVVEIPLELN